MKTNFRFLISFLTIGLIAFTLTSCGGGTSSEEHGHDHGTEEKAGDGHNHGDHDGHNHGDHEGHDHGDHEGHNHGDHEGHNHDGASVDMTSAEYASTYVCPMHCKDSGSAEAGTCPACGMEYVLNAEHQEDGHKH